MHKLSFPPVVVAFGAGFDLRTNVFPWRPRLRIRVRISWPI